MVGGQSLDSLHLLEPLWDSAVVHRESSVLMRDESGAAVARLAYPAARILEIRSASGTFRWPINGDVRLRDEGRILELADTGPIEVLEPSWLYPPKDSPNSYRHRVGDPETYMLYQPGHWFHDHNIEVTYTRRDATAEQIEQQRGSNPRLRLPDDPVTAGLSRTLAKLRAGEPLTIGVSGDSISTGLDASGKTDAQPQQPGYAQLIVAQLAALSGSDIDLVNRSVAGWSVANGVQDLAELLKSQPDLIIVAYGMNDVGRRDPRWYRERTEEILRGVREANAETEVILVSTMLGNDQWIHTPREMFPEYRDQLRELQGPTTAFADATEVWTELLEHKHFHDLTGNGLNHPNDCGHRLYAQAILRLLATRD